MRIAQIVYSLERRHGGPSVSVPALAAGLAGVGHEVSLLASGPLGGGEQARAAGVDVQLFARSRSTFTGRSAGLRQGIRSLDADVLHSHGLWLRPLHYAHRRAHASGARHVISPRGMMTPWAWNHNRWKKALADRFVHPGALKGASGWHATSQAEADEIRALGFSQPVCVAPNGVNAPRPEEIAAARQFWLQACPEAFSRPTALFHSRFHPKKRLLELIDLWLEQAPREWLLLVVGIPETYTVDELADYVHRNLGGDRIRIFDGTSTPPPYVAASLLILPSHSENFGLVVAEAMAFGLPAVVSSNTPWQSLNEKNLGWCVSWDQLPRALRSAMAEGVEGLRERGERAGSWVLDNYSWERTAELLTDFYAGLQPG